MKERPILFSDAMVRAILAGAKTQTRRLVKPRADAARDLLAEATARDEHHRRGGPGDGSVLRGALDALAREHCPFGAPGDRLWVREAHAPYVIARDGRPVSDGFAAYRADEDCDFAELRAELAELHECPLEAVVLDGAGWTPSIHMRRVHSRLTLEVTSVRVERVQDISEADAKAEGFEPVVFSTDGRGTEVSATARERFEATWRELYGAESWDANPWVWVVEFKRIEAQAGR